MKEELKRELHKMIDEIENLNVLEYLIGFIKSLVRKAGQ